MFYSGKTKQLDLITLLDVLYITAKSGTLKIESDSGTVYCYFFEGRCVFGCSQEIGDFLYSDLVNLLTENRDVLNDIKVFAKSHPHFLMEALSASGISSEEVELQLIKTTQKSLFDSLLQSDVDYEFQENEDILQIMTPDSKLADFFRTRIGSALESLQFDLAALFLEQVPVQMEHVNTSTYNKTLNIFILTAIDEKRTVREVIHELSDFDAYFIYEGVMQLKEEGIITFVSRERETSHEILRGMETIIETIHEVFLSIIPLICEDALTEQEYDQFHPLQATLDRVKSRFPYLFNHMERFSDIRDFLQQVKAGLTKIEPQKKLMVLKQGLNAFFIELVLHSRLALGKVPAQENEDNALGMLSFIVYQGSPNHRDIALMVIKLLSLAAQPLADSFIMKNAETKDEDSDEEIILNDLVERGLYVEAFDELFDSRVSRFKKGDPLHEMVAARVLEEFKAKIGEKSTLIQAVTDDSQAHYDSTDIGAEDGFILSRLDTPLTIGQVITESGLIEVLVYRHIDKLMLHGFIQKATAAQKIQPRIDAEPRATTPAQPLPEVDRSTEPADPVATAPEPLDINSREIVFQLKQELIRLKGMLPHEILELSPDTTREQFEVKYKTLKNEFDPEKHTLEIRNAVKPTLDKINSYLDEIVQTATGYFAAPSKARPEKETETGTEETTEQMDKQAAGFAETAGISEEHEPETVSRTIAKQVHTDSDDENERKPSRKKIVKKQKTDPKRLKRQEEAHIFYQKAVKARDNGQFPDAIHLLEQAVQLTPDNFSFHRTLESIKILFEEAKACHFTREAEKALQSNDPKKAVKLLKKAVEIDVTNPKLLIKLASIISENIQNYKQAEYYFRKAIEMEPGNSGFYVALGRMFKSRGMIKEAREQFQEALRWDKKDKDAQKELKLLP